MAQFVRAPKRSGVRWIPFVVVGAVLALMIAAVASGTLQFHAVVINDTGASSTATGHGAIATDLPTLDEQAQFERALVKLANMAWSYAEPMDQRVDETEVACQRLNASVPLLAAVKTLCVPTAEVPQLQRAARASCARSASHAGCVQFWGEVSATFEALATAQRTYRAAVHRIQDQRCQQSLIGAPNAPLPLYDAVAADARHVRVAFKRRDGALLRRSFRSFEADEPVLFTGGAARAQAYIDGFRAACHLAHTKDPPAQAIRPPGRTA